MIYRFESHLTKHPDPTTLVDLALGLSMLSGLNYIVFHY